MSGRIESRVLICWCRGIFDDAVATLRRGEWGRSREEDARGCFDGPRVNIYVFISSGVRGICDHCRRCQGRREEKVVVRVGEQHILNNRQSLPTPYNSFYFFTLFFIGIDV